MSTMMRVESVRSGVVESVHRVSAAVVSNGGTLVAFSGDPDLVTFARSAAKPFQALPLVADGAAERFAITEEELALACASHNSERTQVRSVGAWLRRIGCTEDDLACGPHPPLGRSFAVPPLEAEMLAPPSPLASNCSGKHTGMLALAIHHGWDRRGYQQAGHPVQHRILEEVARWTGLTASAIPLGVDGCTAVSFALPLTALAAAVLRLATSPGAPERAVVASMMRHPRLVAGIQRLGTDLMEAYPGQLVTKVGAEGVYIAALPERRLGLALKVEDGHAQAAMVALVALLEQLDLEPRPSTVVPRFVEFPVLNTRGHPVGSMRAVGRLSFV